MSRTFECVFSVGLHTRSHRIVESSCFGAVSTYTDRNARERGFLENTTLCITHSRLALTKFQRCAVLFDISRCDGPLRPCAERLLPVLDDLTNAVSAYLCRKHKEIIDSCRCVNNHPAYTPPAKRIALELESSLPPTSRFELAKTKQELEDVKDQLAVALGRIRELETENLKLREDIRASKSCTEPFPKLVKQFQKALQDHLSLHPTEKLYNPDKMFSFSEKHAPGLFPLLENAITSEYSLTSATEKRVSLRRLRVVSELHRLAYLSNQLSTTFVNDVGLYLSLSGCSETALTAGRIIGFTGHPKTIKRLRKKHASENRGLVDNYIQQALDKSHLTVLVIDDFHCVHTIPRPTSSETSTAVHMATSIVDIQSLIPSIPLPSVSIHYWPDDAACKGGINVRRLCDYVSERLLEYCQLTCLAALPTPFQHLDTSDIESSLVNQRCYTTPDQRDLDCLKSSRLLDETHQGLKSMGDYRAVLGNALTTYPALKRYLSQNVIPSLGDYPTFFFQKKLVAQSSPDHLSLASIIPLMGPFHMYLNAMENLISLYYPILADLYKHLYGSRKILPKKPQYHRMTTLLASLLGGWLLIRDNVTSLFGICKDPEFLLLRHLLDDLAPLVFYFYATIHRGSAYQLWQGAMIRLATMFIVQQRHNYEKAMLAAISDNLHHETVIPEWKSVFSTYMNVFTEKKVETFHSILRMHCPSWARPEEISEFAHVLSAQKFNDEFSENFTAMALKKHHKHNVSWSAGKTAEYLVSKFSLIYNNSGQSTEVPSIGRQKRRTYHLKNLGCTLDQRSFPLGYSSTSAPLTDCLCDNASCTETSDAVTLLSCGHSFHPACIQSTACSYCEPFLLGKIKDLSSKFNKSLLARYRKEDNSEECDNCHFEEEDEDSSEEEMEEYYSSAEFKTGLTEKLQNLPHEAVQPPFISKKQRDLVICEHDYAGSHN
eukprot:m.28392 g.28392  ORF g.28392 m.28392 type:complete len:944 (+) comp30747_c0_seq1:253-3084(+)